MWVKHDIFWNMYIFMHLMQVFTLNSEKLEPMKSFFVVNHVHTWTHILKPYILSESAARID